MGYIIREIDALKLVTIEEFEKTNLVKHGFSTRVGGKSEGIFATLNLGLKTNDENELVIKNLEAFCKAINIDYNNLVLCDQVHGDGVRIVTKKDRGKGILYKQDYNNIDALITGEPGTALLTFHADCVPLIILDPVRKVIAVSHAGWKGTMLKIGQKTILKMIDEFNSSAEDIMVGIGPSIGKCCYEISGELARKFKNSFKTTSDFMFPINGDKFILDLWEANRYDLLQIGLLNKNIITSNLCTSCDTELFYSYRKEKGLTGRMASVIQLI